MPDQTRKKTGRPAHTPTDQDRERVVRLSGLLVSYRSIARDWLKIDEKRLREHYQSELDNGRDIVVSRLTAVVFTARRDPFSEGGI